MKEYEFLNMEMLSEYIHCSTSKIYKMVSNKTIPVIKLGGQNLFDKEEIDKWVRRGGRIDDDLPILPQL
jgi:excisionase family DNA binding protein